MKRLIGLGMILIASASLFAVGQREDGEFSANRATELTVEASTFDVEIVATRGQGIELQIPEYPNGYTVYHSVSGSSIRVWVERNFPLFSIARSGRLVFMVPADVDLGVDTSTGSVRVAGLNDGRIEIETSTGAVSLERIAANVSARSTTGAITVTDSEGDVDVHSTTGRIEISDVQGNVTATSSTGAHRYMNVTGDIDARSTTGRIELTDVSGEVHLRTSTGNQIARALMLTGDSTFNASTGNMEIDVVNRLDTIQFDLRSTTGSLQVGPDRSQRKLFLAGTGLSVTAETSTGSQHFF